MLKETPNVLESDSCLVFTFMFIVVVNSHENKDTLENITSSEPQLQDDSHNKKNMVSTEGKWIT